LPRPRASSEAGEEALSYAVAALARRDLSREALSRRLQRAGFDAPAATAAVEQLVQDGFLDDVRTARERAARLAERGYGDAVIAGRLREEGIETHVVARVVDELASEAERARSVAAAHRSEGPRRVGSLLTRRGFADDVVEATVADLDSPRQTELR
jgi:SOS response regulatory protein OraA/RecX